MICYCAAVGAGAGDCGMGYFYAGNVYLTFAASSVIM